MKSTAFLVAVIGTSAVTAIAPPFAASEVVMTRTVTVTTFHGARPTHGKGSTYQSVYNNKGSGRNGHPSGRPVASPRESLPGFHGVANEIPEPSSGSINARAPMPIVVMPTLSASALSEIETPAAMSGNQGHAVPTGLRSGSQPHNGTFNLLHVTNHTANHEKGKLHDDMKDLEEWLKKLEDSISNKADEVEGSAI